MVDPYTATTWNLMAGTGLVCLWLLWALLVYDDVRAARKAGLKGVVNCPFCRGMHRPGECKRDKPQD